MAGAPKNRAQAEKPPQGSSQGSSSASRDPTQRSLKSIPRLDGNRDPGPLAPIEYTVPTDLKNISEFLGLAGWYAARGVSTNALLSQPAYTCTIPSKHPQLPCLRMKTGFILLLGEAEIFNAYKNSPPPICSTILSFLPFHFDHYLISNNLPLYITCTIHCLLFLHHDFLRASALPGRLILSTPTCEHWY
jgi:hypothetical protein